MKVGISPFLFSAKYKVCCAYNYGGKFVEQEAEMFFVETWFVKHFYKRMRGRTKNADQI